ncbi:hypothetical protein INT43_005715 [Umbelopsis isabellina]|uniref:Glycoside hydrolase family 55 protein n=1 Tax=Mortierella isabellina TaxID=91625 RepID=A0A8H7PMM6_MORIS|nr:hypothetical protein INT43_005715 [Umbelopsis isabellina]
MVNFSTSSYLKATVSLLLCASALAAPAKDAVVKAAATAGTSCSGTLTPSVFSGEMWINSITHNGTSAFGPSGYTVYRNVKNFGCAGDGVTDDTACINNAISSGGRCGNGCGESTTTPALVYFPAGKYLISSPIILEYYTQMVGNALNPPTLIMAPSFTGIALIDSDPYLPGGANWYGNTNNFYRQVRNFIIDLTQTSATAGSTGIHWQVAQATSLTNLVFKMSTASNTGHQGIWMDNGSGGFMSDLVFNGGKFALWVGNQQFTSRNLTINNCQTAIYMNWNWAWTFKSLSINNCQTGLDMTAGGSSAQAVGSVTLLDVSISNTPVGILTGTTSSSQTKTSGSLLLDNVKVSNVPTIVKGSSGSTILAGTTGSTTVKSWGQGSLYTSTSGSGSFNQNNLPTAPTKGANLLASTGYFFERPRPQYENYPVSSFVSVKGFGAKGDGSTDDTAAIQSVLNAYAGCKIIYFPAGTYIISSTVTVPAGSRLVGEGWSVLMAKGSAFSSMSNPTPMLKIGNAGDTGVAELSDLLFSTKGAQPGAILVQWNLAGSSQGSSGMWDCHFRVGGAAGTGLQSAQCPTGQGFTATCEGAYMLLQLTASSSAYLENIWAWTADHDLDGSSQVSIYTGRGILIESTNGPVWMYGTAAEHNVLYQYQIASAKNVLMAMIQTETPYYQPVPPAPQPYTPNSALADPTFSNCAAGSNTCSLAWGLRVVSSSDVYLYGAGLYNFFYNYDQTCLTTENCQDSMVDLEANTGNVYLYNLNTKAATNMVVSGTTSLAKQADNTNGFCQTINAFLAQISTGTGSGSGGSTTTTTSSPKTTTTTKTTTTKTTTTSSSAAATTTSSSCNCGAGLSCCGSACYSPSQYTCIGTSLCPSGDQLCGTACYSPSQYTCNNGSLSPV